MSNLHKPKLYWNDIWNWAGAVTIMRLLIGVLYPILAVDWYSALCWLLIGALSDSLDGWLARRFDVVSHTGGFIDGWVDKIFGINVAWTIVLMGHVEWWMGWLLFTREWVQIPMVPYYVHRYMNGVVPRNEPFWAGKAASFLLFLTLVVGLLGWPILAALTSIVAGILGMWATLVYLDREFQVVSVE